MRLGQIAGELKNRYENGRRYVPDWNFTLDAGY